MPDDEIRRLALACFLPGFTGETPPAWLLDGLAAGVGGLVLFGSNLGDGTRVAELTTALTAAAGRRLVFALDEEGGDVTRLDTVRGSSVPGAAALGQLDDPAATEAVYTELGARLVEAGVTLNLAPVADVNSDPRNPVIGVRSFSWSPDVAARQVAAAVRGLQSTGVAACVKHFPGHGATSSDSHHEVATIERSRAELEQTELVPFRSAIAAGTRAVMTGHLLVPALDRELATVSRPITTGLLRESLGFDGVIVTDALEMKAVSGTLGMVAGVRARAEGRRGCDRDRRPGLSRADDRDPGRGRAGGRVRLAAVRTAGRTPPGGPPTLAAPGRSDVHRPSRGRVGRRSPPAAWRSGACCRGWNGRYILECRSENGMATGALPWSLAEPLAARCPGATVRVIEGPVAAGGTGGRAGRTDGGLHRPRSEPQLLAAADPGGDLPARSARRSWSTWAGRPTYRTGCRSCAPGASHPGC